MNKIVVSIILAILIVLGINKITDTIYYVQKPEKSAYKIEGLTEKTLIKTASTTSENIGPGDIKALLALGSASEGEKVFKKCAACHSIAKDGANKIGPALWSVLGRKSGSVPNYKYSKALIAHGKNWSFDEMNNFLIKPKDWIKGTKMSFAGLKKENERASVILYMNAQSDNPLPLP